MECGSGNDGGAAGADQSWNQLFTGKIQLSHTLLLSQSEREREREIGSEREKEKRSGILIRVVRLLLFFKKSKAEYFMIFY